MEDIVRKLQEAPAHGPAPSGTPGQAEIRIRVNAETLDGERKRAEAWGETASGSRRNSRWEIYCDESSGEDTAPSPLTYFSAGIAF